MLRRLTAVVLCLALASASAGCVSMLESERFVAEVYDDLKSGGEGIKGAEISTYFELKNTIKWMVENHQEAGELTFNRYDGDVREDIPRACEEVKSSTAIGAYTVEYMSHVQTQIVSYYKVELNIIYKRSSEELDEIITLTGGDESVGEVLRTAVSNAREKLVVRIISNTISAETVRDYVTKSYYENPLSIAVLPQVTVKSYPESGVERIIEILFDYGKPASEILEMKSKLNGAAQELARGIREDTSADIALTTLEILSELCAYAPKEEASQDGSEGQTSAGSTAYNALVLGQADDEGFAMAFKALCELRGVPTIVVLGRLNRLPHTWNIIEIEGEYYHVDASMARSEGLDAVFLKNDNDMMGSYFWDFEQYPICSGGLTYQDVIGWTEEEAAPAD